MSNRTDYVVSCPYCRRQYRMKLDRDEVTQKRTRATCGRCGNSFELAPRITVPGAAALALPLPSPAARRPAAAAKPSERVVEFTADAEDENDFDANVPTAANEVVAAPSESSPAIKAVRTTSTRIATQKSSPAVKAQKSATDLAAQKSSPKITAQSSSKLAATREDSTKTVVAMRAIPAQPARPLTWLERADPGLAHLRDEPSPAALALEELL